MDGVSKVGWHLRPLFLVGSDYFRRRIDPCRIPREDREPILSAIDVQPRRHSTKGRKFRE